MRFPLRRATTAVVSAALAAGALLAGSTAAHATTPPPWEPDANAVGGLLFFNAAGQLITGGNLSDQPLAAYVEGTKTVRSGDTKATLYGYLPKAGQAPGSWSGEILAGPTVYPNAAAPGGLGSATLPVLTGSALDEGIGGLAADLPNTDTTTDGYAGLYQLRLKTTQAGLPGNTTYDAADILISGSTWSVVYSKGLATKTALTVAPASPVYHGTKVTLSAAVTPSTAAGSVKFFNGSTLLSTVTVSAGKASYATTGLADGTHSLKATFVPANTTQYQGSNSSTLSYVVRARSTTTKLTTSATKIKHGTKLKLTGKESPITSGKIAFYNGTTKLATVTVSSGQAVYSTTSLSVGTHSLKATFLPSNTQNYKSSTSAIVKVTVTK